ncbi:MAG TPA: hypothetical protein VKA50_10675 [Gammaproteobacteria bacterium]|nr:hypothetical protein [Gammaproteobacteria bacterium]
MDYLSQFEKILEGNYRIISLETYDIERMIDMFTRLSRFTNKAIYQWQPEQGMHRIGANHIIIPRTQDPKNVLEHIDASTHFGVFILRDFNEALTHKENVGLLNHIATAGDTHRVVVLLSEHVELPEALKPYTLRSRHQLRQAS